MLANSAPVRPSPLRAEFAEPSAKLRPAGQTRGKPSEDRPQYQEELAEQVQFAAAAVDD